MFVDDSAKVVEILKVHAHKLMAHEDKITKCAFLLLAEDDGTVNLDATFIKHSVEDCIDGLDTNKRSVQFLMDQVTTYHPESQLLAGVKFKNGEVLCHVFAREKSGTMQRRFA